MMKKTANILIAVAICFCMAFALAACASVAVEPTDPGSESKVVAVTIKDANGNALTAGTLAADLSYGTVSLSADVTMTSGTAPAVTFAGMNDDVATVSANGEVTLKGVGEAVISATAGDKTHRIVLVVGDVGGGRYTLTVVGGKAQIDGADAWEIGTVVGGSSIVALMPEVPNGMVFEEWSFESDGLPVNPDYLNRNGDNIFEMPAMNITVTAQFSDKA